MNAATLRMLCQGLGVTAEDLADALNVAPRSVERWLAGDRTVPPFAADHVLALEALAADTVAHLIHSFDGDPAPSLVLASGPDDRPLRWQRAIAFQVRLAVPALTVTADVDTRD